MPRNNPYGYIQMIHVAAFCTMAITSSRQLPIAGNRSGRIFLTKYPMLSRRRLCIYRLDTEDPMPNIAAMPFHRYPVCSLGNVAILVTSHNAPRHIHLGIPSRRSLQTLKNQNVIRQILRESILRHGDLHLVPAPTVTGLCRKP